VKVRHGARRSELHRPQVMRGGPRGSTRSVDRGMCRPGIERRKTSSGCRCSPDQQKATWRRSLSRDVCQPRVVEDPGMHTRLLHGNREISIADPVSRGGGIVGEGQGP
jgi:hypothetical protein